MLKQILFFAYLVLGVQGVLVVAAGGSVPAAPPLPGNIQAFVHRAKQFAQQKIQTEKQRLARVATHIVTRGSIGELTDEDLKEPGVVDLYALSLDAEIEKIRVCFVSKGGGVSPQLDLEWIPDAYHKVYWAEYVLWCVDRVQDSFRSEVERKESPCAGLAPNRRSLQEGDDFYEPSFDLLAQLAELEEALIKLEAPFAYGPNQLSRGLVEDFEPVTEPHLKAEPASDPHELCWEDLF